MAKAARVAQKPARRGRATSGRRSVVKAKGQPARRVRLGTGGSAIGARALQARPAPRMVTVSEGELSNVQMALRRMRVSAKYDAAQTTNENRLHWAMADALGPDSANNPTVRHILRMRARHECANNCYAAGALQSLGNDIVGTGPRLLVRSEDREAARRIEQAFAQWARCARLATKLQTMVKARVRDGEAFGLLVNNTRLRSPVMLDVRLIEADLVCAPSGRQDGPLFVDGIEYDEAWNPVRYHVLDQHPGEALGQPTSLAYDASKVLHTYREDRPGQSRGIPELTPALPLFALLRQFILATVRAADHAADYAALMHTTMDGVEAAEMYGDETIEIERGTLSALPEGWTMTQLEAKHPNSTFESFKGELLDEIGRTMQMPSNVIRGSSRGFNYASGRLDHQVYRRNIIVYRHDLERTVLDALFAAWVEEASLVGLIPGPMRDMLELPHEWLWPGFFHVDPSKEAQAQALRMANHTTTLADELALMETPRSLDDVLEQRAYEVRRMRELGLQPATPAPEPKRTEDEPASEEEEETAANAA